MNIAELGLQGEIITCEDREQWLQARQQTLGGSDSPSLFGCGWGTPVTLYADKTMPEIDPSMTERQALGLALEPVVINAYLKKYGDCEIMPWPQNTLVRDLERRMHCTPDALIREEGRDGVGSFSIKTWSEFRRCDWEPDPPLYTQVQLQQELAILGLDWGVIAVLFGNSYLERFYIERNDHFISALVRACGEFWSYVLQGTEPPADESEATRAALSRLHPNDDGLAVMLPDGADEVLESLEQAQEVLKTAELRKDRIENQLRSSIGDHTYAVSPEGRVFSWKTQDRKDKCCPDCGCLITPGTSFRVLRSHKALPKGTEIVGPSQAVFGEPHQPLLESEETNVE